MQTYKIPNIPNKKIILALGAESAGNFSLWKDGVINFSQDFGDLANEQNFSNFKTQLLNFLREQKAKPAIILSDLHPLFETTKLAQQLAKKYKAQYFSVQHHYAHIFSAIGDQIIQEPKKLKSYSLKSCLGITCDGTGLGTDGKIWGGEVLTITNNQKPKTKQNSKLQITRVGHLENQILLGGEMAIQEPARMLIAILAKISNTKIQETNKNQKSKIKNQKFSESNNFEKSFVYSFVKKFYTKNEFEVFWSQLEQNFNCLETSSTARVLDAVSVLLDFSNNERLSKHGPIALLEKNSTNPYNNLNPKIERYLPTCLPDRQAGQAGKTQETCLPAYRTGKPDRQAKTKQNSNFKIQAPNELFILNTTHLFEYLIKNLHRDKRRLAATAQKYLADGMMEIITIYNRQHTTDNIHNTSYKIHNTYFASGGMMNNKIISEILTKQGFYLNQKIPRGDAGLSFGQIVFYLLTK